MSHQSGLQARMSAAILGVIIILWGVLSLNSQEIDKRAVALHRRMLVFDAHRVLGANLLRILEKVEAGAASR